MAKVPTLINWLNQRAVDDGPFFFAQILGRPRHDPAGELDALARRRVEGLLEAPRLLADIFGEALVVFFGQGIAGSPCRVDQCSVIFSGIWFLPFQFT